MLNNSDKIIPTWWCFLLLDFWSWKRHGLDIKVIKIPQPLSSNCHLVIIRLGLKMKSVIKVDDSSNQMHQDYQYSTTKGWTWLELNKLAMSNKHGNCFAASKWTVYCRVPCYIIIISMYQYIKEVYNL